LLRLFREPGARAAEDPEEENAASYPCRRKTVFKLSLGRRPANYDTVALARACEQFTGAEIEAVFVDAMHEAYAEGSEPQAKDILEAITHTVPLAQLMDGQIAALRHWAKGRAREAANRAIASSRPRTSRRVSQAN
jgi:SpoVK/Ycf46/Vps4 family AAA+-type ATPase